MLLENKSLIDFSFMNETIIDTILLFLIVGLSIIFIRYFIYKIKNKVNNIIKRH